MRVVVFHGALGALSGGEVNARDWALGLKARGHRVVAFTVCPGALAEQVRNAGVPVVSDPAAISDPPDIMFGTGVHDVAMLVARFPEVPAIQVAQVWDHWNSYPCPLPQVVLHVAVDELNAELLINEFGVARERVRIVHNAVDTARLPVRRQPLPPRPRRALIFTKHELAYVEAVRAACEARAIAVDVVGYPAGRPIDDPVAAMAEYDLVIGSARVALEGAVAGAAVLVADFRGLAGMLSLGNLELFRRHNFGREVLRPGDSLAIGAEIDRYDAADAAAVSAALRRDATLERQIDRLEAVFAEAIALFQAVRPTAEDARRALSTYLSLHLPRPAAGEPSPRHDRFPSVSATDQRLADLERRVLATAERTQRIEAADRHLSAALERLSAVEGQVAAHDRHRADAAERMAAMDQRLAQAAPQLAAIDRRLAAVESTVSTVRPLIRLLRPAAVALSRVARLARQRAARSARTPG
jgi:hypothetical protein